MDEEDTWYSRLREKWKPERVNLLLIGESAPDDGGVPDRRRFFYSDRLTGSDALFRSVVHAVFDVEHLDSRVEKKDVWLSRLRDRGIFLIDLVPSPVNGSNKKMERPSARRANVAGCVSRAAALRPDGIIICHKPSFTLLKQPLRNIGLPLLHDEGIPFPIGTWRKDFVERFRTAYAKLT